MTFEAADTPDTSAAGEIIVAGEGYKAKASCLNGINSVKNHAPEAVVEESKGPVKKRPARKAPVKAKEAAADEAEGKEPETIEREPTEEEAPE